MVGKPKGEEIKSLLDKTNSCVGPFEELLRNYTETMQIIHIAQIKQKLRSLPRNYAEITYITQKLRKIKQRSGSLQVRRNYAEITHVMQ